MGPEIEAARLDDCQAIAEVHVLSWQHAYAGILPPAVLADLSIERRAVMWHEAVTNGSPKVLVARRGGDVVGFIAYGACRDSGRTEWGEVWALYLHPEHWSRGTGRALWLAAEAGLRDYRAVSLWVLRQNERAIRFYRAAGFRLDEAAAQTLEIGGQAFEEDRYVRERQP
ncbi:MAG: GNAT family N-acetyltransferase [Bryobacteraceae bacterium]|nr:GNAT family N-acetyltransferase [Bryobacteraceae bacterium]